MRLPKPLDEAAATRALHDLADRSPDWVLDEQTRAFLGAVFAASPYLRDLILRDSAFARRTLAENPDALFPQVLAALHWQTDETTLRRLVRQTKAKSALLIAIADLSGRWNIEQVTDALTQLADSLLTTCVNWLLLDTPKLTHIDPQNPAKDCGYTVLAMGKHGANELNYSSDVDLIVLYDASTPKLKPGAEPSDVFVRLTRRLVALMQEPDENGYGFRVDLRLRPDPRATQIAISMEAASIYYESMGQNWERAAMIKARPAAGDLALGDRFLHDLKPYVWRKYLDFAAIADVQSMKRQIHAVKGHGEIAVFGHNIKLGRGGIREIEFFVQTQQLIAGGRNTALRGRRTLEMLDALAAAQWITSEAAFELKQDYRYLRSIEHRIQMVADEQTHTLPPQGPAFDSIARFCGYETTEQFASQLRAVLTRVQSHYARLFEDAADLGSASGSLVFTGGEDDPETIQTLKKMGFERPSDLSAMVRSWHFGRYAATRSAQARERLTEIMPALLAALASTGDADQAFLAFDRFLGGLPAGVQLFSLLRANPNLLELIATILGTAPRLAEELSYRPKVLDAVLDPGFFSALPTAEEIATRIASQIPQGTLQEEVLDRVRVIGKEQMFRIGVRVISDTVSAGEAGRAWSDLADALITRTLAAATEEMITRHGCVKAGTATVIAMGKLGGREMTASSDLDLILMYSAAPDAEMSDGKRPLSVDQYYARLTQRLIAGLSVPTSEGGLYEVDMRLRPSGNKGPVATRIDSFIGYHQGSAWTWEKLALTRARVVAGDANLQTEVAQAIRTALQAPRETQKTLADVREMRALMRQEFGPRPVWDLKHAAGGLVDVEFIAQTFQILHARDDASVLDVSTGAALTKLATANFIPQADATHLIAANALYHRLTQVLRLCVSAPYDPAAAPAGLNRIVASAAGLPTIEAAEALLMETQGEVSAIYARLIG